MLQVKQHDYSGPAMRTPNLDQEPDTSLTVAQNFMRAIKQFADLPFMSYRAGISTNAKELSDIYTAMSYKQSVSYINNIREQLLKYNAKPQDRCIIYAKNSPLWLLSELAIQFTQCVSAPIYDTLGLDNIIYCTNLIKAKFIFVSGDYIGNILGILEKLTSVEVIFTFDGIDQDKVKQQAHKIIATYVDNGKVIDDSSSLFSFSSTVSNNKDSEADEQQNYNIDFTGIDTLIADKNLVLKDNRQIQIHYLNNFQTNDSNVEISLKNLSEIIAKNNNDVNNICCCLFTSGTSGPPKGVLLTHQNLHEGIKVDCYGNVPYHLSKQGVQNRIISYLPLAHVFEHAMEHVAYSRGYHIGYSCGNIKLLSQDLELFKPTLLIGVPRVFAKIHSGIMKKINASGFLVKNLFNAAFKIKRFYLLHSMNGQNTAKMLVIDKVFSKIVKNFGGNLEFVVCGSSALPGEIRKFLEVTLCAKILTGYALTESSVGGLCNYYMQKYNSDNQIGFACKGIEAVIVDRSDACEFTAEEHLIGELCLKGNCISIGYIDGEWGKVKKLVDENGFYHTGDLVKLNEDGSASFIRRVGLVVKLQQGEFVDLETIAQALEAMPLVMQAFVHGEADKTAPVCFVSVDSNVLSEKLGKEVVDKYKTDDSNAAKLIEQYVYEQGELAVRRAGLKGFNVPKAYLVFLDKDWSTNMDYYTPSQKKKQAVFIKAHQKHMGELWNMVEQREAEDQKQKQKPVVQHGLGQRKIVYITVFIFIMLLFIVRWR